MSLKQNEGSKGGVFCHHGMGVLFLDFSNFEKGWCEEGYFKRFQKKSHVPAEIFRFASA